MKETQVAQEKAIETNASLAPQGIGMAVAFDWGLAVQVFTVPLFSTIFNLSPRTNNPMLNSPLGTVLLFLVSWLIAGGLVVFGEMVRSGHNWARLIQLIANILLSLGGLFSLIHLFQSVSSGNFWPVVTEVILLVFSPLIAWRMSRPVTARWFQTISASDARKRHGGKWVWFIALWAIVGGLLQTFASMH